ncbi:protocadherin gamma-B2-like [Spea bombifrons]|uniref:protocadherin gamma-B2-like n=1 Tax=Spea bombifrons TaxID=233779 RepID=UPI00234918D1|nr:protocadherin gamma-B2-like [Spea bombifrons]
MDDITAWHLQKHKGVRWQVIFFLFLFWFCDSVSGELHYSIAEEMRKDTAIANIAKDLGLDAQQLSLRRPRIVSRVSEKYFYVSLENGNVYIKDRIDRESICARTGTCFLTFDVVVENPLSVFKVKLEIHDINDNSPMFFHETIKLEIIESTLPGTTFILQNAQDPDIGTNSVQTYKLNDNKYFSINEKTRSDGSKFPELVLEEPLDRETQNIHELILTAFDGGNPIRSGSALIKVIITDVNDNVPIFAQDVFKVTISEKIQINSIVAVISASDKDEGSNAEITYSFSELSESVFQTFNIHPTMGEVKTKAILDFEITRGFEISLQATDGGGFVAHSKLLIEITDENDNAPEISITSFSTPILEGTAPGTPIALIQVHDQDSGVNGEVDCHIMGDIPFDLLASSDSYYRIVTTSDMDREAISHYNITVVATDRGSPQLSTRHTIQLEILDVNDNAPVFIKSTYFAYVPENNLPGTTLYSIHASDIDYGDNSKVVYSISSTNTEGFPVSSFLSINIETGVIYAQRSFDYEQHKEFAIVITAKDNGSPSLSSNATLMIHIVDQNDNAPKILYPSVESGDSTVIEMVPFASRQGSLITKVVAIDADSGHNAWLSYHFIQIPEPSHFTINQHTGEIRTSRIFHEKDVLKHKIVVMVKDNGTPPLSATSTLNFIVGDSFQQVFPKLGNKLIDDSSNLHMYFIISLALITLLFILTVTLVIISKCKESKRSQAIDSLSTNIYSQVDPRMFSQHTNGTLPLPYAYNVCVALDSTENDFTFLKPNEDVPIDNLIDADDLGLGNTNVKESLGISSSAQVSFMND